MTTLSPLRKLAREYYEGQIGRAYYVQQRRYLIVSLAGGHGNEGSSNSATIPGLRQESEEFRPDSSDLSHALANQCDDISAPQIAVSDITTFFHLPRVPADGFGAEALAEQSASIKAGEANTQDSSVFGSIFKSAAPDASRGSSRTKKLLLIFLLLSLSLSLVVWFTWGL